MTRRLTLTVDAQADLVDIYDYTFRTWGRRQAEAYTLGLEQQLATIDMDEASLRPIPERKGLFRFSYQAHIVVLRLNQEETKILRILHERMDMLRHI